MYINNKSACDVLISQNAILAHCVANYYGAGNQDVPDTIYDRIRACFKNDIELACSTIVKGDYVAENHNNYFGPIGLIIVPGEITHATSRDAGSWLDKRTSRREYTCNNIPLIEAIRQRPQDNYNEICVKNYSIPGIFISIDTLGFFEAAIDYGTHEDFYNNTSELAVPYYFMTRGNLFSAEYDSNNRKFHFNNPVDTRKFYEQ